MIWFDLVTPKSVMFFKNIIKAIEARGESIIVTARGNDGYTEVIELLELYKIKHYNRGIFGGSGLSGKLKASIERQRDLMEFVSIHKIDKLVCLCSVDACRVAFGLGIPIVNYYDIPLSDYRANFRKALPQARLTIPLSTKVFHPYIVPREIFQRFCMEDDQIITYNFYDVFIWLHDFEPDRGYYNVLLSELGLDPDKPTVVVREEEYKSSYVDAKYPFLYEGLEVLSKEMDANFIVVPRYESGYLEHELPYTKVLNKKIIVQHLLAFADLFIGGGGTLNAESCFFGTPTISTRSFICHYDKVLLDKGLMFKADTKDELISVAKEVMGKKTKAHDFFSEMDIDIDKMVDEIIA